MQQGARRFLLPPVPTDTFVEAADAVVRANDRWVPPFGKGALYLRPLLMGTGENLGVKPSWESTFCIYCSPVGNYFKGGLKAIRLKAVKGFSRAAMGGSGAVKASGNYAPAFMVQRQVRERGSLVSRCCKPMRMGRKIQQAAAIVFGDSRTAGSPPLTQRLYKMLLDLQTGADEELNEKYEGWIHIVEP